MGHQIVIDKTTKREMLTAIAQALVIEGLLEEKASTCWITSNMRRTKAALTVAYYDALRILQWEMQEKSPHQQPDRVQ